MKADEFYQSKVEGAISLFILTYLEWQNYATSLSQRELSAFSLYQFKGKLGDICLISDEKGNFTRAYIGAGETNEILAIAHAVLRLPPALYLPVNPLPLFATVMWSLAQYRFDEYKKQPFTPRILVIDKNKWAEVSAETSAIFMVRDLINQPTNVLGPATLAEVAEKIARKHEGAHFKQWIGKELNEANFPAIYAVGQASAKTPRLLELTWGDIKHPRVALIGKGVCFDSGGLNIKPWQAMRFMKKDMGGAAHVLALADWVMTIKLPVYLEVLIPAVENAIGPESFRPGDILTMRNGLTVEIDNTDAEGRLILADALVKAGESNPDLIINFATLTGAARVAVGTEIAAFFTDNEQLAEDLMKISKKIMDPLWRLPLFEGYKSLLDSSAADMLNSGASPYAGAITAALFLKEFLTLKNNWVHFDMMAWNVASKPGKPEGGEAMGLRAIAYYLKERYKNKKEFS